MTAFSEITQRIAEAPEFDTTMVDDFDGPAVTAADRAAEMLSVLSPSAFAVRHRLLRAMEFPEDGRKTLVDILVREADATAVENVLVRTVEIFDVQNDRDTKADFVKIKTGFDEVRSLALAFASYDAVFVIRSKALSFASGRLVDMSVDLQSLACEDVEAALSRHYPGQMIALPVAFTWPDELLFAALDLVCSKAATGPEAVEKLVSMSVESGEIVPERLGLTGMWGYGAAKAWAHRLVDDLDAYRAGHLPWRDIESGMLLIGPPGTGKSQFARRVAGAAGVPLIATSYSAWQSSGDGHLGDVTKCIQRTFEDARSKSPCIVFIDEFDSIPARATSGKDSTWFNAVVNALLEALDGHDGRRGIVVMAACNDGSRLDTALLRPGRLNRPVRIELPDAFALSRILAEKLDGSVDADALLPIVTTMAGSASGADMVSLALHARRRARDGKREVVLDDVAAVALPSDPRSLADRRRIAIHEGGHVLAALMRGRIPAFVTIVPFGDTQGSVRFPPDETPVITREHLHGNIVALLAGRAAELIVFGEPSAGAGCTPSSDLATATETAVLLVGLSGLDSIIFEPQPSKGAVEAVLLRADADARSIMTQNRVALEELADLLVERRTLTAADLRTFARDRDLGPFGTVGQVDPPFA